MKQVVRVYYVEMPIFSEQVHSSENDKEAPVLIDKCYIMFLNFTTVKVKINKNAPMIAHVETGTAIGSFKSIRYILFSS
jgi:hypothetical protein